MVRSLALASFFFTQILGLASAQSLPAGTLGTPLSEPPRCGEIARMGPEFSLLGNACDFALSHRDLPNFICQEKIERSVNGKPLDTVTANVTFVNGSGDRYSDIAINDHPVTSLKGSAGWNSLALFGTQLMTIFLPTTRTIFTFDRNANAEAISPMVFGFHFNRADNATFGRGGLHPGLSGSIFVDRKSGEIRRVDATATELDPASTLVSYASSISYGDVAIPDLGAVLAPAEGNVTACVKDGTCYRNDLSFHDCRKFGSTARIISGAGNDD